MLDRRDIGLKLSVPEGAIQDEVNAPAQVEVHPCLRGPFKMPPGYEATSPIYMIKKQCKFQKDIKMEIEHFASLKSTEDCEEMVFITAKSTPSYQGSHPVYNLQEVQDDGSHSRFTTGEQVGVITFRELQPGPLGTARKSTKQTQGTQAKSIICYDWTFDVSDCHSSV